MELQIVVYLCKKIQQKWEFYFEFSFSVFNQFENLKSTFINTTLLSLFYFFKQHRSINLTFPFCLYNRKWNKNKICSYKFLQPSYFLRLISFTFLLKKKITLFIL